MKKLILGLHIVTFTGALFCMQEDQMRKEDQQWEWSMQISQQSKMGNEAKERCNSLTIAHALNQQFRKDKSNNQLFKIPLGQRLDMITKNYLQEITQFKEARAKGRKLGQTR